jgi:hypothetical protein
MHAGEYSHIRVFVRVCCLSVYEWMNGTEVAGPSLTLLETDALCFQHRVATQEQLSAPASLGGMLLATHAEASQVVARLQGWLSAGCHLSLPYHGCLLCLLEGFLSETVLEK